MKFKKVGKNKYKKKSDVGLEFFVDLVCIIVIVFAVILSIIFR